MFACNDDDKVRITNLQGTWNVVNDPNIADGSLVEYTFSPANKTCVISIYAWRGKDTTYVRSYDNSLITMYEESSLQKGRYNYTEQYYIKKLISKEMKWENASPNDGNPQKVRLICTEHKL